MEETYGSARSTNIGKNRRFKKRSAVKVIKVCDICNETVADQPYYSIITSREKTDGRDRCKSCAFDHMKESQFKNPSSEKTLAFKYPYISSTWNYELNKKDIPEKVFAHTNKVFWFTCKICKSDFNMSVSERIKLENSCPYCSGRRVNHTNCIQTTHPKIAEILWNFEDGLKFTMGTENKIDFKCPECKLKVKNKIPYNVLRQGLSCPTCSDGISYPEKFFSSMLLQIYDNFEYQKTFDWSKNVYNEKLAKYERKFYDFYLPLYNCIVEVHGKQHYESNGFESFGGRTMDEEQYNDKIKENLALANKINYIIVKCNLSNPEYLKKQIIDSELSILFDLSIVDWDRCNVDACKSLISVACEHWSKFNDTKIISGIMKLNRTTVTTYLKQGAAIGWCDYDPKYEMKKNGVNAKNREKIVYRMTLDGRFIDEYKSASEAAKICNLSIKTISASCTGRQRSAGGFKWMYKSDYEKQIINQ